MSSMLIQLLSPRRIYPIIEWARNRQTNGLESSTLASKGSTVSSWRTHNVTYPSINFLTKIIFTNSLLRPRSSRKCINAPSEITGRRKTPCISSELQVNQIQTEGKWVTRVISLHLAGRTIMLMVSTASMPLKISWMKLVKTLIAFQCLRLLEVLLNYLFSFVLSICIFLLGTELPWIVSKLN